MHSHQQNFDKNQTNRIKNLLMLKGECLALSDLLMSAYFTPTYTNFYLTMSDAIDVLLISQINDEITASLPNRGMLVELLTKISQSIEKDEVKNFNRAIEDLGVAFRDRTDFLLGSQLLDFSVSSFSVFEKWMSKIYNEMVDEKEIILKKKTKALKMIDEFPLSDDKERDLAIKKLFSECSPYISSAQKIEILISKAKKANKDLDSQPLLKIVKIYSLIRNSIHNLGVNISSTEISVAGVEVRTNLPSYSDDHSNRINLCRDLVNVYKTIVEALNLQGEECLIETQ